MTGPRHNSDLRTARATVARAVGGVLLTAILLAGCNAPTVAQAKRDAKQRWTDARAAVLYGVGVQHLEAGQLDYARNKAMEALALQEDYLEARVLLGKVYIEQGYYDLAHRELETALTLVPESRDVLYLLAVAQEKGGQLEEALKTYRRTHALDPSQTAPIVAAAEVLVELGRAREAQLYLDSYLPLAGSDPSMYELSGRLAIMQGDPVQGARHFQRAVDLDPQNGRYIEALGRAQFHAGQHEAALDTLRELQRLRVPEGVPAWAYIMMGDCQMALRRPADARDAYQQARDLDPQQAGPWSSLAKAAVAMGDLPRAILSARRALELDAASTDALLVLGYALVRDGQVDEALAVLQAATRIHPESGTLHCLLGQAHALRGDPDAAAKCYSAAVRAEPANAVARELLAAAAPAPRGVK